ncbi:MAG: c-type cytochrome [Bryobacteraceae bacterium]
MQQQFLYSLLAAAVLLPLPSLAQQPAKPPAHHNRASRTAQFLGLGPAPDQAAAKKGKVLFGQNCAGCHGENARGGEGPDLLRSLVVLHDNKGEAIGKVVRSGPGIMPAFTNLTQQQIYQIAEYLHEQVYLATNRGTYGQQYAMSKSSGNAQKGKEFFSAHCASCHSVTGDLAHIGSKYPTVDAIQNRFLWPKSRQQAVQGTVTTPSGQKITGKLKQLNDFDVALTDAEGHYHYWPRQQVKVSVQHRLAAHRALLPVYTDADIHNLAAYLLTIK